MIGGGWVVGGLLYGKKVLEGKSVCCCEHSSDVIKPFKAITLITSLAYLPLLRGFNYQQPVYSPCLSLPTATFKLHAGMHSYTRRD